MADMFITKVRITPEMAADLLEKNHYNRPINKIKVARIINDIKTGNFELTHQPIGIDEDGVLVDGQHRLTAIVECGIPVDMFVAYNAPRSTKIDIGLARDTRTALYMAGILEKGSLEYKKSTYPLIRMIVCLQFGYSAQRTLSDDEIHAIYVNHQEMIDKITEMIAHSSKVGVPVRSSLMSYVLLCAYAAGVPIDTLKRWYEILCTGNFVQEDSMDNTKVGQCVQIFINYAKGKRFDVGTPLDRKEEFIKKAMSSISHFEKHDIITKLYGEYVYPLYYIEPEDMFLHKEQKEVI
ncbi:MAG: hypothetical protein IIZ93_06210 [Acidaminococcaceae bacterium]|nr:hypothetical protein [Acidaminococcaceae bacterium]